MKEMEQLGANEEIWDADFPIVGIGASAGGLEALESFLKNVPEKSGLAFIVVQHQDPTREGILVELLQRATSMPVIQVQDNTLVQPDCVYVSPPNKDVSILHRQIHLLDYVAPRGHRLPIDYFFRSLADDQQERSIGVILSGMGTDGTLGLRAIKEKGGTVFVQEPSSAKFDSMPRSAIKAGLADVVSPVDELPSKIVNYLQYKPLLTMHNSDLAEKAQSAFEKIVILLRSQTGHDFSSYKKTTVFRRIERRMGIHQFGQIAAYVNYLQKNPQELELLFKELLIGVTNFFREPAEWELLKEKVFPALLAERAPSQMIRAWVSACATGEEAYSLAIVFKELMEQLNPDQNASLQIFATDLDRDAIDKAREAVYPANIAADVSPERLRKYFKKVDRGYQVAKPIRDMVIFAPQNIIMDPPFTKLDILCCRNLLIYLTQELQKKILPLFHYSLNSNGFLFLGSAETVGTYTDLFEPVHKKSRIYQRLQTPQQAELVGFPSSFVPAQSQTHEAKPVLNIQALADQLILQKYSPPTVLVNSKGDILYITGRTGKYLEPAAGKANWNIFAMTREGLHYELSDTFQKALRQKKAVTLKNAVVKLNGGVQAVNITVQPFEEQEALHGMIMIVFNDVEKHPHVKTTETNKKTTCTSSQREIELERELMQARQDLHVAQAEMQASHEELKSFNEELQSTNEELQSTNEELTTSKEEMQSLNEELQTVNYELQSKIDELSLANNDMRNLMNSTEIATLFLDKELRVRRYTSQMSVITRLIPGDVGRPVTDIASGLFYPELMEDVRDVLRTLNTKEKQVTSGNGLWFNVRILPYRTADDKIDGVVITFVDITEYKEMEATLRKTQSALENRLSKQDKQLTQAKDSLLEIERSQREIATGKEPKQGQKPKNT